MNILNINPLKTKIRLLERDREVFYKKAYAKKYIKVLLFTIGYNYAIIYLLWVKK